MKRWGWAIGVGAVFAAGCYETATEKTIAAQWDEPGFREFVARWNTYQMASLQTTAELSAKRYAEMKKNAAELDPKREVRPESVLHFVRRFDQAPRALTPAINVFEMHVGTGLVGNITEEAARMRVWVADRNAYVGWFFVPVRNGVLKDFASLTDGIGNLPKGSKTKDRVAKLSRAAFEGGQETTRGADEAWFYETRLLRFGAATCMTCHTKSKLNDRAGVMVYLGTKNPSS